ncbi:MAG: Rpn family recombination-promoting nuclease/putative transposase [Fibromonadales bacterium]|nr:Rpn family recombination-promoting nuclease/putative transposase [Fibromonadales bacterium]
MAQERTLVSFDWAIKNLLRSKADYVILEGFLTTLLGKAIKIKNLTDSESNKNSAKDRINRVDILAEEKDKSLIIIELQFTYELDYFHRMLFGSSKAIVEHMKEGMDYSEVRKVYSINIVYFDLGGGKDYIYHGTTTFKGLHCKDELKLTAEQKAEFAKLEIKDIYPEYYLLRVNWFKNVIKSKLDEWMYFLKNSAVKPKFKAPGLNEAYEKLEYHRLSLKARRAYDHYVDRLRSDRSTAYTARLEGKAEGEAIGIEKGKTEERIEIAKGMKAEGINIDIISKVTGLSKAEVLGLCGQGIPK